MCMNIDLRNNDALRMQLVHQDLTEDGRDRRMNAYIRVTKAYVEKKSPNHPRLMLWTDDVESSESGDYIGKSPDLYADEEYLYYFKKGYWPLDFETHVGEGFYPWTTLLRMSKGICPLSQHLKSCQSNSCVRTESQGH